MTRRLCVIPARGGSVGIKNKNLRKISGLSLVSIAAKLALSSKLFDEVYVSSDAEAILADVKKNVGLSISRFRPSHLAGPRIGDLAVLVDAIEYCEEQNSCDYSTVVMLQPTSPDRTISLVKECVQLFEKSQLNGLITVESVDLKFHPLKQFLLKENQELKLIMGHEALRVVARQELLTTYIRNGLVYVFQKAYLKKAKSLLEGRISGIVTASSNNIDNICDLRRARKKYEKNNNFGP
jgi:CMP-N,N'-diacetyllegionaminic acid synthase